MGLTSKRFCASLDSTSTSEPSTQPNRDIGGQMISLLDQLAYDRWANHQYLDAAVKLDNEQFTRNLGSSFPSVRDTFVHLAWAEWLWVERWQGRSPQLRVTPDQFPTLAELRTYIAGIEGAQVLFLQSLPPGAEAKRIRYTNLKGETWEYTLDQMVHHLGMHSAFHRGQIATLLRQLGAAPPTTDYLVFLDAHK